MVPAPWAALSHGHRERPSHPDGALLPGERLLCAGRASAALRILRLRHGSTDPLGRGTDPPREGTRPTGGPPCRLRQHGGGPRASNPIGDVGPHTLASAVNNPLVRAG